MRNMEEALAEFIDAIKASEEYLDYTREKNKVKQFPELKEQIDAYRQRNYEIQSSSDVAFETIEQFEREYAAFRENMLVADFLAAELAFCRLMQKLNLRITESLDFE